MYTGGVRIGASPTRATLNFIGAPLDLIFCRGYGPAPQGLANSSLLSRALVPNKGLQNQAYFRMFWRPPRATL